MSRGLLEYARPIEQTLQNVFAFVFVNIRVVDFIFMWVLSWLEFVNNLYPVRISADPRHNNTRVMSKHHRSFQHCKSSLDWNNTEHRCSLMFQRQKYLPVK